MTPSEIRNLFKSALPDGAHAESDLKLGHMYLPSGHIKAIDLDRPLVIGDRGAGKSFWLKSLVDPQRRTLIGKIFEVSTLMNCEVKAGFDPSEASENFPDARILGNLTSNGSNATDIWHAVMVNACVPEVFSASNVTTWAEKITWVNTHVELVATKLYEKNAALRNASNRILIAFDGLDRVASKWDATVKLIRGLLQAQLELKKYSNIHTKAFIRPDLFADPGIRSFPDASKLISLAVKLEWTSNDLYGLTWQYLANSDNPKLSAAFRKFSKEVADFNWPTDTASVHVLSEQDRGDESKQKKLFHAIAGVNMGGSKRGDTWTWLPKHLADTHGYTSPRSFLVALRSAAEIPGKRNPVGPETALHHTSIMAGVSKASAVRRNELEENFSWISDIFKALRGLSLPSRRQDITARWRKEKTLDLLYKDDPDTDQPTPLPDVIDKTDAGSILLALEPMGLCRILSDGRIDFPDIVRVDAGMTRKGTNKLLRIRWRALVLHLGLHIPTACGNRALGVGAQLATNVN
jgi:hypothetical protein